MTRNDAGPGVLPRRLGVLALALLIIAWNAPIAVMAGFQQLAVAFGNGSGAPLAFLVAGGVLLSFATGFIAMSSHIHNPGAFYSYIVAGLGKIPGLAGAFVATAAYILFAIGSYVYLGAIVVDMTTRVFGTPVLSWQVWALASLLFVTGLGLLRIDLSVRAMGVMVLVECLTVALWELAVMVRGGPEGYSPGSWSPQSFLSGSAGLGVLFAMLCMIGFEGGACFRDEVKNPRMTVKCATLGALGVMTLLYAVGCWAYIVSVGASQAVSKARLDPIGSFLGSVDAYMGRVMVDLVAVVLVTSQVAALLSIQGNGSRYLFALGRDRVLPERLTAVHSRLQSPHVAVLTIGTCSLTGLGIVAAATTDAVRGYAVLTGAGIYFLLPLLIATSAAIVVYFRRHPSYRRTTWTTVVAPASSAIALTALLGFTTWHLSILTGSSGGAIVAVVVLLAVTGAGCAYAVFLKRTRPGTYTRIGNQYIGASGH